MDYDWLILNILQWSNYKMKFRSGSTHPGFTKFFRTIFLQFEGWMMNVGIWRTSFSCPVPLGEERFRTLELWIGNCYVVIRQRL